MILSKLNKDDKLKMFDNICKEASDQGRFRLSGAAKKSEIAMQVEAEDLLNSEVMWNYGYTKSGYGGGRGKCGCRHRGGYRGRGRYRQVEGGKAEKENTLVNRMTEKV